MGYIYVFEFPNGKRYVGQTMNPKSRFSKYHYSGKVREAIDYFGWDNVNRHTWEVPDSQMDDLERFLISVYRSNNPEYGYNIHSGGTKGFTYTASCEHRSKISESLKGIPDTISIRLRKSESMKHHWAKKKGLI